MLYIEVPDEDDSLSMLSIDGKEYGLRFTYNEKYDYWSFGLYDEDEDPIIAMTRIVPNFPIFHFSLSLPLSVIFSLPPDSLFFSLFVPFPVPRPSLLLVHTPRNTAKYH